jgi:hypothetical protein
MDSERKSYICYQCRKIIPIPEGYIGDTYVLLEIHYLTAHGIVDLKAVDWKKPMTLRRILDLEIDRLSYDKGAEEQTTPREA